MGKIFLYYRILLRRNMMSLRMLAVLLVTALVMDAFLRPVREFCGMAGLDVSQWGFSLFWGNKYVGLTFMLLFAYGASALTDDYKKEQCIIGRIGREGWITGQLLYQLTYGWLYAFFLCLLHLLLLSPVMRMEKGWGRGWGILTDGMVGNECGILLEIPYYIISNYRPVAALVETLLLLGLTFGFLASLLLWMRFYGYVYGAIAASLLIFWSISMEIFGDRIYRFSPLSWIRLNRHYQLAHPLWPTTGYAALMLILFTLLFFCLAKRKAVRIEV
ncbi:MAG: hypothetical protein Q4C65_05540 [Eubacteriales bacterium]|nr:hypothetical protein [Eubacteriales bacterium]